MRKMPQKPKELWMLWVPENNNWAMAIDDPVTEIAYLCALDGAGAEALQIHQEENYDIEGIPVRVI